MIIVYAPAFNRAYVLLNLYNRLIRQFNQNIDWLIIHDGSQDNTRELVSKWIKDDMIKPDINAKRIKVK